MFHFHFRRGFKRYCSRTFLKHAVYKISDKELGCIKKALYCCSAIYKNDIWVVTRLSILFQVFSIEFVPRYYAGKIMHYFNINKSLSGYHDASALVLHWSCSSNKREKTIFLPRLTIIKTIYGHRCNICRRQ